MCYEFKLFDTIIDGELLFENNENKDLEFYTHYLKQRHTNSFNLVSATFKKSKLKFTLQQSSVLNSLHPHAHKFYTEQLDLFQDMPINEVSNEVFALIHVLPQNVVSVHYKQLPSTTILHVKESITWESMSFAQAKYFYYNDIFKAEVNRIKEAIKLQVFNFSTEEDTVHYIHKLQQALINICYRLCKQLNIKEQNDIYKPAVNFTDTDILFLTFISLEDLLRFCEKNYFSYIDQNIRIPYKSSLFKIYKIDEKLEFVKEALLLANIPETLLRIIYEPFIKLNAALINERMSYKELIYLNTLLQAFYDEIIENNNTITEPQIHEILYQINYNAYDLQFYKTAFITNELQQIESLNDKIDYLYHRLKLVNQRRCRVHLAYDSSLASLKDQLTLWIEEEINYFNKKLAIHARQQPNNLFTETENTKIETSLTVAQLALFYKLQLDVGMIKNKVLNDVSKHLAESYQTTNAADISQSSIKKKFYNYDTSTIEVLKHKVIEILNQLNRI